jgi:hypothetical protein
MKGVLTMKGSGCVRVTASGACAAIGSLNDDPGAGQTLLSIRRNATTFVETMFNRPCLRRTRHLWRRKALPRPMGMRAIRSARAGH